MSAAEHWTQTAAAVEALAVQLRHPEPAPERDPVPGDAQRLGPVLRQRLARAGADPCRGLARAEWRRLPLAFWVDGEDPLPLVEPERVALYWQQVLPAALARGDAAAAARWRAELLAGYANGFGHDGPLLRSFAASLVRSWAGVGEAGQGDAWARRIAALDRATDLFTPSKAVAGLAADLKAHDGLSSSWLARHGLWPDFFRSALGRAVMRALPEVPARPPGAAPVPAPIPVTPAVPVGEPEACLA
jgi:hypothetical protein